MIDGATGPLYDDVTASTLKCRRGSVGGGRQLSVECAADGLVPAISVELLSIGRVITC